MSEKKLTEDALKVHDNLSEDYYKYGLMSKEDFDYYHGEIWSNLERERIAAGYLVVPETPRDLEAEIDELRAEIEKIKNS